MAGRGQPHPDAPRERSPFGEWFVLPQPVAGFTTAVFHGGWGKVAAAASAQHDDRSLRLATARQPRYLRRLSPARSNAVEVLLADETLVYDIVEQMTDPDEAIAERAAIDRPVVAGRPDGRPPASTRRPCAASV